VMKEDSERAARCHEFRKTLGEPTGSDQLGAAMT